jgi:D-3-phosphoglycerate dehydrogenase
MTGGTGAGRPVVLVTDYAWPNLDIERDLLHTIGARVVVGNGLAPEAVAIMTNWARVGPDLLESAPGCVVVARYGVGVDSIDVARATELGIVVTNVPDVPLTPRTAGLIGAVELARMKPTAFLVNTARGGVVDLAALSNALAAGSIRGAASRWRICSGVRRPS